MNNDLLSDDDLIALTGSDNRRTQKKILSDHGVRYIAGANGRLSVTWTAVNFVLCGRNNVDGSKINWSALDVA